VNQESLDRANAFLAAVAARVPVGQELQVSPAEIGREIGVEQPLAAARAVRALLARRRLEIAGGSYRLLDARPVEPGEREQVTRGPRRRRPDRESVVEPSAGRARYSDIGREAVERLVELGRDVASLRASLKIAREEARESREARDEAERRARALSARIRDLEARAEMAESNLRTLLATAKGAGKDAPVASDEMEAILGVLKNDEEAAPEPAPDATTSSAPFER
jgi:uncharacterized membrane protein YccC